MLPRLVNIIKGIFIYEIKIIKIQIFIKSTKYIYICIKAFKVIYWIIGLFHIFSFHSVWILLCFFLCIKFYKYWQLDTQFTSYFMHAQIKPKTHTNPNGMWIYPTLVSLLAKQDQLMDTLTNNSTPLKTHQIKVQKKVLIIKTI